MQQISENVYVETDFRGCNTGFITTAEGVVVIDTPMIPSEAKKWSDEAAKYGPIRYVINTEPHLDHFAGNCYFNGIIIGHEGTRAAVLAASLEELKNMLKIISPESQPENEGFSYRAPVVTLSERLTIYLGEHTIQLIHMPGHSPYQVAVYVPEEKVVFTSDNVSGEMPFFRQALPYEWLDSLKRLQQLDVDKVIPGHGDIGDKNYFSEMISVVNMWMDVVASAIDKGMSLEETQGKTTFPDKYPSLASDAHMVQVKNMNIARLFEVLKR